MASSSMCGRPSLSARRRANSVLPHPALPTTDTRFTATACRISDVHRRTSPTTMGKPPNRMPDSTPS